MANASTIKKSTGVLFVVLLIVSGCLAWLFVSADAFQNHVVCIVDGFAEMEKHGDEAYVALNSGGREKAVESVEEYGSLVQYFILVPGSFVVLWLLMVVLCTCRASEQGYYWAKWVIFLANLFLLIGIAFYAVVAAIPQILEEVEEVKEPREEFEATCDDRLVDLRMDLKSANTTINDIRAAVTPGTTISAAQQRLLDQTMANITSFEGQINRANTMCTCMKSIIDELSTLRLPAVVCAGIFVVIFLLIQRLCCLIGCLCGTAKEKKKEENKQVEFMRP